MDYGQLQGWQADPFGLHQMRYFSAGTPTKLVRDGNIEAYDEPPADWAQQPEPHPAGAGIAAAAASSADGSTADGRAADGRAADGRAVAAASSPAAIAADGAGAAGPQGTAVLSAVPWAATAVPPATGYAPPATGYGPPAAGYRAPRNRRLSPVYLIVALAAIAAVIAFVAIEGASSRSHSDAGGLSPAAFVTAAAHKTLGQDTADVSLVGTVQVDGQSVTMHGTGKVDLAHDTSSLDFTFGADGTNISESELEAGGHAYIELQGGPTAASLLQATGGKHWIELPGTASQQSAGTTTDSPAAELAALEQTGARVTPQGSRDVGGQTCTGYAVTPSEQGWAAAEQHEAEQAGVPAAQASSGLAGTSPPTIDVWFNQASQLACGIDISLQMPSTTSGGLTTLALSLTFTNYGTPVSIAAPAASDTISLQQLLTKAGQ